MSTIGPGGKAYYLDKFTDEIMPCEATLEAWAAWLSKPDDSWPHDIPSDGDTFAVSIIRFDQDIVATRHAGGEWTFDRDLLGDPSLLAVRYGPGLGWCPENIVYPCSAEALREFLSDPDNGADDEEWIAVGYDEPDARYVYKADPPRLIEVKPPH